MHFTNPDLRPAGGQGHPFSRDGHFLVFGSADGLLTLVDMEEIAKEIRELDDKIRLAGP